MCTLRKKSRLLTVLFFLFDLLSVPDEDIQLLQLPQTNIWMTDIMNQSPAGTTYETQFPKVPFW